MKKKILTIALVLFTFVVNAQEVIKSVETQISNQASFELEKTKKEYEFVEFPIDKLLKSITKKKNIIEINLGKSINDIWEVEENELLFEKLTINKWDDLGNPLPNKEYCETFLARSKNKSLNIRFTLNTDNELSGFVHDLSDNSMTHFKSISLITNFKDKNLEKNKIAIYKEKFNFDARQSVTSAALLLIAPCQKKWIVMAVETDAEFTSALSNQFSIILNDVDYLLDLNLGLRVYFRKQLWTANQAGYPYNNVPTISYNYIENTQNFTATRTSEPSMFDKFINNGWHKTQTYNMAHLITGRRLRNPIQGNSGGYSNFSAAICSTNPSTTSKPLSMSSSEFANEQIARTKVHELGHNLAPSFAHDSDPPFNNVCVNTYSTVAAYNSNTTPNTLMCTFINITATPNDPKGGRGIYFSSNYKTAIMSGFNNNNSCLIPLSAPTLNQAYYNNVLISSTPHIAYSRNAPFKINISNSTNPFSTPTLTASVSPSSVFLGPRSVSGVYPDFVGIFNVNTPSSVNNATFTIQASNACGSSATRTIPIIFSGAFRMFPNPTSSVLNIELNIDNDVNNFEYFLPETISLSDDKNKILRSNEVKNDFKIKKSTNVKNIIRNLSDLKDGTYFLNVNYGNGQNLIEKVIIQK